MFKYRSMYVHWTFNFFLWKPDRRPQQFENSHHLLRKKSVFNPHNADNKYLDVFKNMITEDLEKLQVRKVNYPHWIKKGFESIEQRKKFVIWPADKGGGLVIMTKQYYIIEMERQLGNNETYHKLSGNPLLEYKSKLERVVNKGGNIHILSINKAKYLNPIPCHTPFINFFA